MLALGPVRYDIERGEMWRGEKQVRLTATESQLMRIFAARPGEAVSRQQLVEDLGRAAAPRAAARRSGRWTCRSPGCAARSRATREQPRYLQTVRGAGYMLAPD